MQIYLEHFGLVEAPFKITPHTEFFFSGGNRGSTLEALLYAVLHDEGIVKVSGEVGSGKTMLCRVLMERLPENIRTVYLANPSLSRDEILYALSDELGLTHDEHARSSVVLRRLQEHLIGLFEDGHQVVVMIDEAHAMPAETLEEIRLLSNLESKRNKLLQLVLFGQPELDEILARADMRQLKERVTHNFKLEPLVRDDITSYIDFRMRAAGYKGPPVFSREAVQIISRASQGLTRRVNILADKSLLAAFSSGAHGVGAAEAKAAVSDSDFSKAVEANRPRQTWKLAKPLPAALFSALIAATAAWQLKPDATQQPSDAPQGTLAQPQSAVKDVPVAAPSPMPEAETHRSEADKTAPAASLATLRQSASPGIGPLSSAAISAGEAWIKQADAQHWFLQLLQADGANLDALESYLATARKAELDMAQVRAYVSEQRGTRRVRVIYGDFASKREASEAIESLPASIRAAGPYVRPVQQLL